MKAKPDIWQTIAKDKAEAETMRLRADLAIALRDRVAVWDLTQAEAAKRLGISQPRLSELLKGRIGSFRLDRLTRLASKAGCAMICEKPYTARATHARKFRHCRP
ncbi:helix-turn-helix transcriptional regulator [uncultured Parvibaculum sp.]|uniref:helix-turn-helix domain-containing protein n=1 Tax=uncultured Parvibaculum sp. TaxID=291828 RepID=UPI0030DD0DAD|tara:strand:- start:158806 stop:159120 length:315 start_codon:yes stop_codon:yes gene_type:complete